MEEARRNSKLQRIFCFRLCDTMGSPRSRISPDIINQNYKRLVTGREVQSNNGFQSFTENLKHAMQIFDHHDHPAMLCRDASRSGENMFAMEGELTIGSITKAEVFNVEYQGMAGEGDRPCDMYG